MASTGAHRGVERDARDDTDSGIGADLDTRVDRAGGLEIFPVRALRYSPDEVADVAAVTAPPYDVIEPDGLRALEARSTYNVVRLTLPRGNGSARYDHAADTLRTWMGAGVLVADARPALHVYEQEGDGQHQIGIIAAVGLGHPGDGVVLPHEDVVRPVVDDRRLLMQATGAQVEPILLVHDHAPRTADLVAAVARRRPASECQTDDGFTHRTWIVDDPVEAQLVRDEMAGRSALIADGHHRFAAYRSLADADLAADDPAGQSGLAKARNRGLALLVDREISPPRLNAIHRTVPGLSLADAINRLPSWVAAEPLSEGEGSWPPAQLADHAATRAAGDGVLAVLLDGSRGSTGGAGARGALLRATDRSQGVATLPPDRATAWAGLDVALVEAGLIDAAWGRAHDQAVHHDPVAALDDARRRDGVAVMLPPVDIDTVVSLARRGVLMPRKSTSFGPKPRSGLVIRHLATDTTGS